MRYLLGFFRKLWHGLDIFRRVLHLLLLVLIFAIVIGAFRESLPRLPERGALVIRPSGDIVEQLSGEPFERALSEAQGQTAPQTLLWDLLDAIRAGASDDRIRALLIETDELGGVGQAKLEELSAAIAEFRKAGKKVVARGSSFDQAQYYLAAQADEVYLDPFGWLLLQGYGRYRMYYKDALDKLAVDVHLYRAGKFKSAAEPYVRNDMSAEEREESLAYLQALWRGYRTAVARARGKQPEDIAAYAEQLTANIKAAGGNAALVAKNAGLVTDIKTADEVNRRMVDLVGVDPDADDPGQFRAVELHDYLQVVRAEAALKRRRVDTVGVIVASGEIVDGFQPPGTIGGSSTAQLVRRARLDDNVKAVVLRVDSPGGSVYASEEIYREVLAFKAAGKSLVVSMSDLAASGGYYIAAPADQIFASANTITGSIGVYGALPTFSRSLNKLGINVDGVGTAPLSGALRLDRPMTPALDELLQATISRSYEEFLTRVASGRSRTRAEVDAIAQGRVWAGSDALRLGLVDAVGGYDAAVKAAASRAGLKDGYRVRIIEPELTWAQQLLFRMRGDVVALLRSAGIGAGTGASPGVRLLQRLQPFDRELQRIERFANSGRAFAYCFCVAE